MTKAEIENRICELEEHIWYIEISDFLNREDMLIIQDCRNEIRSLKKMLEEAK